MMIMLSMFCISIMSCDLPVIIAHYLQRHAGVLLWYFMRLARVLRVLLIQFISVLLQVGFETEGTAIYDTMMFVKNEVRRNPARHGPSSACLLGKVSWSARSEDGL